MVNSCFSLLLVVCTTQHLLEKSIGCNWQRAHTLYAQWKLSGAIFKGHLALVLRYGDGLEIYFRRMMCARAAWELTCASAARLLLDSLCVHERFHFAYSRRRHDSGGASRCKWECKCKWKAGDEINRKYTPASWRGERILKGCKLRVEASNADGRGDNDNRILYQ